MGDVVDILLRMIQENWDQARQSENQRATITNLIVIIAAGIHAIFAQTGFSRQSLPLSVFLVILGLFGLVASAKLYERALFHTTRARKFRARLDELFPDAQLHTILNRARDEHSASHPRLWNIRLNHIWLLLQGLIILLGVIYIGLSLI